MKPPRGFRPEPYPYHHELELEIQTLTNLGHGLGRDGAWVVMVPFALPGERVRARVWRNHKNFSEADLVEVLRPGPGRVEPACPLFGRCAGCQYQHFHYEGQLEWKRRQVREVLQRIGGLEIEPLPVHPSPRTYGYRSKLTPHYPRPAAGEPLPVGFLGFDNRRVVDVPQCPIATQAINAALPAAREDLRARAAAGQLRRGGTLLLRDTPAGVLTDMAAQAEERVGEYRFQFPAGEFFQNNPFILPELVEYVLTQARAGGARCLVDAYCGAGVFAICGADRFERVTGVEISEKAVAAARANADRNGRPQCVFRAASAELLFAGLDFPPAQTAVILDPPRRGCDESFLQQLCAFRPARVVYVSCDPATQARDLRICVAAGFRLVEVQPFDLFPQTRHLESVAVLALDS